MPATVVADRTPESSSGESAPETPIQVAADNAAPLHDAPDEPEEVIPEVEDEVQPTDDSNVTAPQPEVADEPVTLQSVKIEANADEIQFANVAFEIENTGNHISRARVTLEVSHNGEVVEEFVIDDNLPLPVGTTSVEDRYIPPTGWDSGTWQFSVIVHSINSNENVETVVVSEVDVATIEVP